jgi:hypothetical protein
LAGGFAVFGFSPAAEVSDAAASVEAGGAGSAAAGAGAAAAVLARFIPASDTNFPGVAFVISGESDAGTLTTTSAEAAGANVGHESLHELLVLLIEPSEADGDPEGHAFTLRLRQIQSSHLLSSPWLADRGSRCRRQPEGTRRTHPLSPPASQPHSRRDPA